jgi:N-acetyl-anhydromuramyl-L-alanine amidase AmpD
MKRIIIHWTAGSYVASALDRQHYHRLIEGDGKIIFGFHAIESNRAPIRRRGYAAHTLNLNSDSIGIAICAMAGAKEAPFELGKYQIRDVQWDVMIDVCAKLCRDYSIVPDKKGVLTHAEVEEVYGIKQRGKWDIRVHPDRAALVSAAEVGFWIRQRVRGAMQGVSAAVNPPKIPVSQLPIVNDSTSIWALQRALGVNADGIIGPKTYRAILERAE